MLALKVPLKKSQETKLLLLKENLLNHDFKLKKQDDFIYFPVKKEFNSDFEFVDVDLDPKLKNNPTLKQALTEKLPAGLLQNLKTSYDQVGDIAILEIDDELVLHEKLIGNTLLKINPHVKTVLAKDDKHSGTFRTQKMRFLAGLNKTTTMHKENNVRIAVEVGQVYFSVRLSTERKRIAEFVKPNENILIMFSGCGPYTCVLAKKAASVTAIEINPVGYKLAQQNIALNKLTNVTNINGDVKKVIPELNQKFDRILMPLPKDAENFLEDALKVVKKGAVIHFYAFLHEDEFRTAYDWIKTACGVANKRYKILKTTKCGQHAPRVFRICVDIEIM